MISLIISPLCASFLYVTEFTMLMTEAKHPLNLKFYTSELLK